MATIKARKRSDGGTSWQVRIKTTIGGEQYTESRTFSDARYKRRDAEAWARARERELETGASYAKADTTVTLADLTTRYIREFEHQAGWGKTKAADLRHLRQYDIANRPVVHLKAADFIEHIRLRRGTGIAACTANNDLIWWRIIYKIAIGAWGMPLTLDPIDSAAEVLRAHKMIARPSQRTRRPELRELELLLEHFAESRTAAIPMVDIILFQLFSARRIAETCALTWADYDPTRSRILVRDMKDPRRKAGNHTTTALTPQAITIIERQPRAGPLIFPYNSRSVSAAFRRSCRVVGIKDLHLHDLRHEATSWLFEQGLDIPRVAKVTGHRSWQNLQRYAHLEGIGQGDKYAGWRWLRSERPARLAAI